MHRNLEAVNSSAWCPYRVWVGQSCKTRAQGKELYGELKWKVSFVPGFWGLVAIMTVLQARYPNEESLLKGDALELSEKAMYKVGENSKTSCTKCQRVAV